MNDKVKRSLHEVASVEHIVEALRTKIRIASQPQFRCGGIDYSDEDLALELCNSAKMDFIAGFAKLSRAVEVSSSSNNVFFELPTSPKLSDLKSRTCTLEELQSALVHLIELFNEADKHRQNQEPRNKGEWQATI